MARIVGVDLPKNKRGEIGLTYVYGIGRSTARMILDMAGIDYNTKVDDWTDEQVGAIRNAIAESGIKVDVELYERTALTLHFDTALSDSSTDGSYLLIGPCINLGIVVDAGHIKNFASGAATDTIDIGQANLAPFVFG